jgi:Protein of unknown function (DUF3168)
MRDYGFIKCLRTFLLQQTVISEKMSGFFTAVPPGTRYPYLTLGLEGTQSNGRLAKVTVCLNLWSAYQGLKEIQDLALRLQGVLESPNFLLSLEEGASATSLKPSQQRMDVDPQGIHRLSLTYETLIRLKRKGT